jgi:hypothetical protein
MVDSTDISNMTQADGKKLLLYLSMNISYFTSESNQKRTSFINNIIQEEIKNAEDKTRASSATVAQTTPQQSYEPPPSYPTPQPKHKEFDSPPFDWEAFWPKMRLVALFFVALNLIIILRLAHSPAYLSNQDTFAEFIGMFIGSSLQFFVFLKYGRAPNIFVKVWMCLVILAGIGRIL